MTNIAAGITYKPTAHLDPHTTIVFQGKRYVIEKINPKNYVIKNVENGKRYNLNRWANITVADEQVTPDSIVALEVSNVVEFDSKGGERHRGVVARVNGTTATVIVPERGQWRVSLSLLTRVADAMLLGA